MSFDSLTLRIITDEMSQTLLGATIRHIEQSNPTTFSIKLSQKTETHWITISAHSVHARVHLIQKPSPGQKQSYFADFLSTHLRQGTITNISQIGWDRILKITVQPKSEEHIKTNTKSIIAEFMGKHSNIILIDDADDRILECLKHIDETMSRYREVLPGETYTLPPQMDKVDPLTVDKTTFFQLFDLSDITWKSLFNKIDGLSPTLAKEIITRAEKVEPWDAYQQVLKYFNPQHAKPQIIIDQNDPIAASPMPLLQYPETTYQPYATMSEALSAYYDAITLKEMKASQKHALTQAYEKQKVQLQRKTNTLKKDLEERREI